VSLLISVNFRSYNCGCLVQAVLKIVSGKRSVKHQVFTSSRFKIQITIFRNIKNVM